MKKRTIVEVDSKRKFVAAAADWLAARVRTGADGAASLAHLMVVVPTAQSGRRLRLALARHFASGLIPPVVRVPAQFALPPDNLADSVATRTDELVAFWEASGSKGSIDGAAQLADIRHILGARALTFADVADRIGGLLTNDLADLEVARWRDLADLEQRYLAALARRGRTDRTLATQAAIAHPRTVEGVEEVVLAGLLDPLPLMNEALDRLGLPVIELVPGEVASSPLRTDQIVASGTAASESWKIGELFAGVKPTEALPALCLADAALFPEIQGALQAKGLTVHNPSATPLATSSLGHLVARLAALKRTSSYAVFSAFLRCGDVRRWIKEELGYSDKQLTDILTDLDNRQAQYLPEKMEDIGPKTTGPLRNVYEFVAKELRKKGVRELLESIFRHHLLDEQNADAREFVAASEAVSDLLDECLDASVPPAIALELFERRLGETTYSLEPDEGDAILTDGWLELPFLDADELVIAGFQEGCVPESVVGHAFLPDALRRGLGLPDNAFRSARDRRILDLALACRQSGAVRIYFHGIDAQGNVLKPSRLLFEGADDAALAERVKRFYGLKAGTEESSSADLPAGWRLDLPVPPERTELAFSSPSSLDAYLKCPFTYLLSKTFGDRMDDRAEELEPNEFGALAHEALEGWAEGPLKDSEDAAAIADDLAARVDQILQKRFGTDVPAIVDLQGESIKRRLAHFASVQVAWHAAGWRIVASERKLEVAYGHTRVKGRCDRIDYNEATGEWCVIDYKTWDSAERASCFDEKKQEWKSLQLPLYCAMLDAEQSPEFAAAKREKIVSVYCILGKTEADVRYSEPMRGDLVAEAEVVVRRLIDRIERGVFWPPDLKRREWEWEFKPWIFNTPEESVNAAWLEDQLRRLAVLADEEAAKREEA